MRTQLEREIDDYQAAYDRGVDADDAYERACDKADREIKHAFKLAFAAGSGDIPLTAREVFRFNRKSYEYVGQDYAEAVSEMIFDKEPLQLLLALLQRGDINEVKALREALVDRACEERSEQLAELYLGGDDE